MIDMMCPYVDRKCTAACRASKGKECSRILSEEQMLTKLKEIHIDLIDILDGL